MRKIILLAMLLFPFTLLAQNADELFEQNNFTQALTAYQQQAATVKGDPLYKVQLRIIASQFNLGEYINAAKSAFTYPLPQDPLWQARFLLYRIATAQRVQNMYRPVLNKADEETTDLEQLSSAQWEDKINESYDALWALRKSLLSAPLAQETLILNLKDADLKAIPTLFDFVVLQQKERLQYKNPVTPLRAADVLTLSYKAPVSDKNDVKKLLGILAEAAQLGGRNRADARIIWQADLLTLPFEQEAAFSFDNKEKQRLQAAELLQELSGYKPAKKTFFGKLTSILSTEKADYGKSYAALKAAQLLNNAEEYAQALSVCDWTKNTLEENYYTQQCSLLAADIRRPVLNAQPANSNQNPVHTQLAVSTRNADQVFMRLYPITLEDLKNWNGEKQPTSWNYLTYISSKNIPQLLTRQPMAVQVHNVSYDKPHAFATTQFTLPELKEHGLYAAAFSLEETFDPDKSPLAAMVLNATDLALFVTSAIEDDPQKYHTTQSKSYTPNVFRIYTLNLKTGQSVSQASVAYFADWKSTLHSGTTDENGLLALPRKINVNGDYTSYRVQPKATHDKDMAFLTTASFFSFHRNEPVKLYSETDRAIYRPGQTVKLAVYALQEAGRGLKPLSNSSVQLTVRDTNYKTVFEKKLSLNTYGTAQTELTLPDTGLLGTYSVEVSHKMQGRTYSGHANFQVEEYKRPEYEVTLSPAATLQYGKEAHVSGKALYYFGAPLEKATVKYTVKRKAYHPPFWWWRPAPASAEEILTSGETQTDAEGNFTVSFTPKPGAEENVPYNFQVSASVLDDSGRAIDATQNYKAAKQSAFFSVSFDKGFYDANDESILARVQLLDVNNQPQGGKFTAQILALENLLPPLDSDRHNDSLDSWYSKNKVLRSVSLSTLSATADTEASLTLPALPEGIYKLKLTAKNADPLELVFLVAAEKSNLALPAVAISQYKTYYPGSQAKILLGAQQLQGPKRLEVYQEGQFLAFTERLDGGVGVYTLPIQNTWRGGISLRWFGASDYQFYEKTTGIEIPYDNKALTLSIQAPQTLAPGQKVNWTLTARDGANHPVNAQASLRVYDKSLDYYAAISPVLSMQRLYPQNTSYPSAANSKETAHAQTLYTQKESWPDLQSPVMPQLNLQARWAIYGRGLLAARGAAPMVAMAKSAAVNTMAMADSALQEESISYNDAKEQETMTENGQQVRTDFSETAYFNAQLPINGGKATASFTMPQSLTTWNIQSFAFTPDVHFGTLSAQTITRKDVMVRLSLPRFWREMDKSTLVAQVTNVTNKKRSAQITLTVQFDGQEAAARFGLEKLSQTISIPANGNTSVSWPISIAKGVGLMQVTASVHAGNDTDAESRELPVLPSMERLTDSAVVALDNGSQTLQLDNLLTPDDTRAVTSVTLRVDPGLLLSVFNTLPQLLRPGYNDALSLANRYVPLAVVNAFYKTYPLLRDAVGKLPHRGTQTPVWNETDPSRLVLLSETPWLTASQGAATRQEFLTDLFNPAAVEQTRNKTEKQLAKYQTASGGYSWMPGGKPNEFITLRLLSAYAQILRYGGEIKPAAAQKALTWLTPLIEKNLKQATPSASSVSYALYAAYVFTAFPKEWKAIQTAPIKKWLDYAGKHAAYMTPLGQTYAAAAYYRLGQNTKAQNYLDLVLSRMKTDPVTGAYFAPEAQSWLWYNDTLTTQTTTLRTLLELRPESDKSAELVKWLLFNRQAQVWQDTTAAAETVYALLDYMQQRGLLDDPAEYTLQWGDQRESLHFEPMDFSQQLSWTQTADDVSAQYYSAQVTKRGGLTGFVSLDAVYTTAHALASQPGVLNVSRRYLLKYQEDGRDKVREITAEEEIPVGAEVEVQLTLTASSAFDFVLLADPKPAGFENTDLSSGWTWDVLSYYREVKDAATHFFLQSVPAGTYTLRYTLRPTLGGQYQALPAQVQSMYAPQFSAHTASDEISVK